MTERDRIVRMSGFDPDKSYTPAELEDLATKMLYEQRAQEKKELTEAAHKILTFLLEHETGYPAEIADTMAISESAVQQNLGPMIEKGWVEPSHEERRIQFYRLVDGADLPPATERPVWLNESELNYLKSIEIYSKSGQVDPALRAGMFWRPYPEGGREINPPEVRERDPRAGFYK